MISDSKGELDTKKLMGKYVNLLHSRRLSVASREKLRSSQKVTRAFKASIGIDTVCEELASPGPSLHAGRARNRTKRYLSAGNCMLLPGSWFLFSISHINSPTRTLFHSQITVFRVKTPTLLVLYKSQMTASMDQEKSNRSGQGARNKRQRMPKPRHVDNHDEPSQISQRLRKFTEDDWMQYVRDKGTLRGSRQDGMLAGSRAFDMAPGVYKDFYHPLGRSKTSVLKSRGSQSESNNQSLAADAGIGTNLSAGLPGAQIKPVINFRDHSDGQQTSSQDDMQKQHSEIEHFVGMQTWFNCQRLVLSQDCIEFFTDRWCDEFTSDGLDSLPIDFDKGLRAFEKDFGRTFYQHIELGVQGQDIMVSHQDYLSRTDGRSQARQIGGGLTVETPKGGGGLTAHRDRSSLVDTSTSTLSESRAVHKQRSGGDPSFALTGKFAKLDLLNDPHTWLVIDSLSTDPIPVLDLVRLVAKRLKRQTSRANQVSAASEASTILERVSELIDIRNTGDQKALKKYQDAALSESRQTLESWLRIGKTLDLSFPMNDKIAYIELRQHHSTTQEQPIRWDGKSHNLKHERMVEIHAKLDKPIKGSDVFIEVKIVLKPAWEFVSGTMKDQQNLQDIPKHGFSSHNYAWFVNTNKETCVYTVQAPFDLTVLLITKLEATIENQQLFQALVQKASLSSPLHP
jgi:hypothetical protein